jgi:uncharacterized FlaG/YvyC family protein
MVDPISNAPNSREIGTAQNRPQSSPVPPVPGHVNIESGLAPDQRVEVLHAAVEKLIRKSLPPNSKLQIEQDKDTGTFIYRSINPDTGEIIKQWPPEQLLKMKEHLREMEGLFVDKHA